MFSHLAIVRLPAILDTIMTQSRFVNPAMSDVPHAAMAQPVTPAVHLGL